MGKEVFYRQCRLKKDLKNGSTSHQVSYIPEPFCTVGRVLKLRNEDGVWDNGWVVTEASSNRISEPPDIHKEIRGHRKTTGDSLPK
jgi:hypothetical protein